MLKIFKRTSNTRTSEVSKEASEPTSSKPIISSEETLSPAPTSLFARLKQGLKRTRTHFAGGLANLIFGKKVIDSSLLEEIETHLLLADVGVEATQFLIQDLTNRVARKQLTDPEALMSALKDNLASLLIPCSQNLVIDSSHKPYVILMVGVNGNGKTTTIGKLANYLQKDNQKVLLAAGDTFRAAAIEQLQAWGAHNQVAVINQHTGADSASVIYDALQAAQARKIDVLIADTAGRLHTQQGLMEELKKIKRVLAKLDSTAPHEILLVVDASTGQNALQQAQKFHQAIGVTGLVITKLDGTAKGGILFSIAKSMSLPIRFIGVGEGIDDLRPFDAKEFVEALFTSSE